MKTSIMLFVLGFMVSCASYHNQRSISSFEKTSNTYVVERAVR